MYLPMGYRIAINLNQTNIAKYGRGGNQSPRPPLETIRNKNKVNKVNK